VGPYTFIQSYVNIKSEVEYVVTVDPILIIHKACNSTGLKIVPLLASSTFRWFELMVKNVIFKFVPVELMVGLYIFELTGPVGF
jgi:hypothetical protein